MLGCCFNPGMSKTINLRTCVCANDMFGVPIQEMAAITINLFNDVNNKAMYHSDGVYDCSYRYRRLKEKEIK